MEYMLLWIAALLTVTVFTALTVAVLSRIQRRMLRHLGVLLVILLFTFIFGIVSLFTGLAYFNNLIIPNWLFQYFVSFGIIYLISAIVIWRQGLSVKQSRSRALDWKKGVLALATCLGIFLTLTIYFFIDLDRKIEFSNVNSEIMKKLQIIWPSKPASHLNSFPLYQKAAYALKEDEIDLINSYNQPDQYLLTPEIKDFLDHKQDIITIVHKAADMPICFFNYPFEESILFISPIPSFLNQSYLGKLIGLKAKLEIDAGNQDQALEELSVIKSMAEHKRSMPYIIGMILSGIDAHQGLLTLEYILSRISSVTGLFPVPVVDTPSVLQLMKDTLFLEAAGFFQVPFLMMQEKRVIDNFIEVYSDTYASTGAAPNPLLPFILHSFPRSLWRVFIGQIYLETIRDSLDIIYKIGEPDYKHWKDFNVLRENLSRKQGSLLIDILNEPIGGGEGIDPPLFGYLALTNLRIVVIDVYHRLMDLAVAATAYHDANGLYPSSVEELVPAFLEKPTIDPYDGKSLKIKKVKGGLDLYSIGPKGEDKPIHFYLGREAYEEYRVKPAREKRLREAQRD